MRSIRRYTVGQWGPEQYATYRAKLKAATERLTAFPALGVAVPHIAADLYALAVEQHVIYHRFDDQTLTAIAIVHGRMHVGHAGSL